MAQFSSNPMPPPMPRPVPPPMPPPSPAPGRGPLNPTNLLAITLAGFILLVVVVMAAGSLMKSKGDHSSSAGGAGDDGKNIVPPSPTIPPSTDRPVPEGTPTLPKLTRVKAVRELTMKDGSKVAVEHRGTIVGVPLLKSGVVSYQVQ
jgi:hypothetical protein